MIPMKFEWDENKRKTNLAKHGLDFSACRLMFEGPHLIFQDARKNYGENRFNLCWRLAGRLVMTTFVLRDEAVRIISLRKVNGREEVVYGTQI